MTEIGTVVRVKWGRNAGQEGKVAMIDEDLYLIDFGRDIEVDEGFGSYGFYPDAYWSFEDGFELA